MKKKRKKFKLFDIETGLVLVINEETRWTEKHSETWMPEVYAMETKTTLLLLF